MKLCTQTDVTAKRYGEEKAIEILAKAGYDAIDISCFDMLDRTKESPKNTDNYVAYAKKLKKIADDNGVTFDQAHAPFPSSLPNADEFNEEVSKKIIRSMEFCGLLGVKNIIVHPKQHLTYREGDNPRILKEINLEFYNSLIPYCNEFDINVCVENMWQYDENRKISHSTCSTAEEFKEYLDLINSDRIVACLDIGHANLMGADLYDFITVLGDKLQALHVHDTGFNNDLHRVPYVANTDWEKVLKGLADIDYKGDFTFEADNTLIYLPDDLIVPTIEYMVKVGRSMISKIEAYKNA